MADVSYPVLQGEACTISHNCLDEVARSLWVTDSWSHVFVLEQGQRARQLHCVYAELVPGRFSNETIIIPVEHSTDSL
jgi:hypothetical protein